MATVVPIDPPRCAYQNCYSSYYGQVFYRVVTSRGAQLPGPFCHTHAMEICSLIEEVHVAQDVRNEQARIAEAAKDTEARLQRPELEPHT